MSNYNSLKTTIDANVKQNGNQEITGQILNSVLNAMVNTLGAGYQFAGVATTATNPGSPDAKVFYIANGKGTYTNFGGLQVTEDDVVVLYWDSSWHKVSTGIASQEKLSELMDNFIVIRQGDEYKLTESDKIYWIIGDITLSNNLPPNCILYFNGGSIGGVVKGDNTKIIGNTDGIFRTGVSISGTWDIPCIKTSFFKDLSAVNSLKSLFALQNDSIINHIIIEDGIYPISKEQTTNVGVYENILELSSNSILELHGTIQLITNNTDWYAMIGVLNKSHIVVEGTGKIIGDKETSSLQEGEHGHGIRLTGGKDVIIRGIDVSYCFGDCISVSTEQVYIQNCILHSSRRQGVTIGNSKKVIIENCKIYDIAGTLPSAGIDIEPDSGNYAECVIIRNNEIYHCGNGIDVAGIHSLGQVNDVIIDNNYIHDIDAETGDYHAIAIHSSKIVRVSNNRIVDFNRIGIRIANINNFTTDTLLIENNRIIQEKQPIDGVGGLFAIDYHNGENVKITGNYIDVADYGMIIRGLFLNLLNNVLIGGTIGSIAKGAVIDGNKLVYNSSYSGQISVSESFVVSNIVRSSHEPFIDDNGNKYGDSIVKSPFRFSSMSGYSADSVTLSKVVRTYDKITLNCAGVPMTSSVWVGFFSNALNEIPSMKIRFKNSNLSASLQYFYFDENGRRISKTLYDGINVIPKSNSHVGSNVGFILNKQNSGDASIEISWIPSELDL